MISCKTCKWSCCGNNANYSCDYCCFPGHNFKLIELEQMLGHIPSGEEFDLIVPPKCIFYEERIRK